MDDRARRKGETIKDWIFRISNPDTQWYRSARRRRDYKWYYDFKFWFMMRWSKLRGKFGS